MAGTAGQGGPGSSPYGSQGLGGWGSTALLEQQQMVDGAAAAAAAEEVLPDDVPLTRTQLQAKVRTPAVAVL